MVKKRILDHIFYRSPQKRYPVIERGEGIYLFDIDGKRYIDGSGGACVVSIGHGVSEIADAASNQMKKVAFAHGSHFTSEVVEQLAEKITSMANSKDLNRVYFISGGSEAVETSIKLARQYWVEEGFPTKYKIISRWTSFHGNTIYALSLSGHTKRRAHYLPLFPHNPHVPTCYCYRCDFGKEPATCSLECADFLEKTIKYAGPDSVAAFIAEPIIGATAGAVVPKNGYWQRIREICDKYNILLIADEVMTGIGRTGESFATNHWDISPDMAVLAKGLTSGYAPLGAVVVHSKIHEAFLKGTGSFIHGHTYGQHPVSAAVGLAVLEYIEKNRLIKRSRKIGLYFIDKLKTLLDLPIVGDVRGLGLMAGIEFVRDKKSKETFEPALNFSSRFFNIAFEKGLITYPGNGGADGIRGDHILLAPPFIITEEQIDVMVEILREAIIKASKEVGLS
ncbi:MAG: aspartate aminotransferase family protein [Deltaproteobacteria bacterium]|nr:MAG: aspartate aminotransferase family protein [Deltaproteobacteria bacterium]